MCDMFDSPYPAVRNIFHAPVARYSLFLLEVRDGLKAVLSRQRRGKAAMSLTEARQRQRARGRGEAD